MTLPHLGATCGADTTGGAGEGGIGRGEGGEEVEKEDEAGERGEVLEEEVQEEETTQSPSLPVVRSTVSFSPKQCFLLEV